jgi:hypothetical protein
VAPSFEDSFSEFLEFLGSNGYPANVAWVQLPDVLLSGGRLIYVKLPIPPANEQRVRELFDISQNSHKGILFGTICAIGDTTYAYAWTPTNSAEAEAALVPPQGLKMSAKTGLSKVPGKAVRSRVRWAYLRWALASKQQGKEMLFS